jgi:hypothetical protein
MKFLLAAVMLCLLAAGSARAESPADHYLAAGKVDEGLKVLAARLAENPKDQELRYNLGVLRFVHAVERLGRSLYRFGLRSDHAMGIPFLRLPLPRNPHPDEIDYSTSRRILQDLIEDLRAADRTLEGVGDSAVRLPIRLGLIRLDLDGTGKASVPLRQLLARYLGGTSSLPSDSEMRVVFDRADVAWFRGYTHLLAAQAETVMAYGGQELFDCTAQLFFSRPRTPYPFLTRTTGKDFYHLGDGVDVVDVVALVHLIRLPLKDVRRLRTALADLEQTIRLSRESWRCAMAETDDDHEWLPNPRQKGMLGVRVTPEMISGWLSFLDELDALLAGRRLIPFWRSGETRGVNLRRVFTEPRPFDLVLWFQGTAAAPYLESGIMTRKDVWDNLWRVFQGQFMGFAIWFN